MTTPSQLTQLHSPCGKYTGFFENGKSPEDWTTDKAYRVPNEEFKDGFYWHEGNFVRKFEKVRNHLKEKHCCRIVFEDITFTEKECLEILENALINDLEETSCSSSYSPWENLFNLRDFFKETIVHYGIIAEIKDFDSLMSLSGYGTYNEIKAHSISEFRIKMKDKLSFV